ncbi:MAG: hypothetical protein ACKN85_06485, partial [Pirellula sp.]
ANFHFGPKKTNASIPVTLYPGTVPGAPSIPATLYPGTVPGLFVPKRWHRKTPPFFSKCQYAPRGLATLRRMQVLELARQTLA